MALRLPSSPIQTGTLAARSILVVGGARSGKSSYAEELAVRSHLQRVYVATAAVLDDEMRARVERHRTARGAGWRTIEEPIGLVETVEREAAPGSVLVVDCLTLWLTNLVLGNHDAEEATARLGASIPNLRGPIVFVSNEVGSGIVPDNPLARRFRDAQGGLNQTVARACDAAVLVAAGCPVLLKPNPGPRLELSIGEAGPAYAIGGGIEGSNRRGS